MRFAGLKRAAFAFGLLVASLAGAAQAADRFEVTFAPSMHDGPLTGRLVVVASPTEPKGDKIRPGFYGPPMFGVDLTALAPGQAGVLDDAAKAFPLQTLKDLPAGDYWVQALVITYGEAHRADGRTIWAPLKLARTDMTELDGNLYSTPVKVHLDPAQGFDVKLVLDHVVKNTPLPDTPWIKRVRIKSKILSDWWGVPMYLSANVLLPKGWAEHPDARYPVALLNSFDSRPFFFDDDPNAKSDPAALARDNLQSGYDFYRSWTSDNFPRIIGITLEQPCPFFLEAYSVDSANCGPFGEALTKELIPYLEAKYHAIGKPYARLVEGASTGGWEALNLQLKYPDYFGGAWVFNPDPIDFHHDQLLNAYKDDNAFTMTVAPGVTVERSMRRTVEGQSNLTMRELSRWEDVMGSHARSGGQFEGWEAIHSPVGPDGYPEELWDKQTGKMNPAVAEAWRANGMDLTDYARRNWSTLGPKLRGKLNIISGEMDNFYLNLAVYDFDDMLKATAGPDYPARFVYGRPKKGHSWHHKTWDGVVREMADQVKANAPKGENTAQWNY
ncbi:MAG TPA: alpha/beta hydrolase-fold protein [Caulobacteraceae bacterium]|jgi:hypothetical protein